MNNLSVTKSTDGETFLVGREPDGPYIRIDRPEARWIYDQTNDVATRHKMTSGLATILVNVAKTVHHFDRNDIHIYKEIAEVCEPQPYAQLSNITKLRFHGLVFKIKNKDGKQVKGRWGITKKGGQWLRGEIEIEEIALSRNNRVVGHEGKLVHIKSLRPVGAFPFVEFENSDDVSYSKVPAPIDVEPSGQARML